MAWPAFQATLTSAARGLRQEFALVPPVEAQTIRLVCTRNADAASAEKEAEIPRRRRYLGSYAQRAQFLTGDVQTP